MRSDDAPAVKTGPGATAFTRTPLGLNSAAHAWVIDDRAAFVAPYAAPPASPIWPAMLLTLMMLPLPLAAIFGASAGDQEIRSPNVAREQRVECRDVEIGSGTEPRETRAVHQYIDLADVFDQALKVGRIAEVGPHETGAAAPVDDRVDRLRASVGVSAVDDDRRALARQLERDRLADAGRRAGYQRRVVRKVVVGPLSWASHAPSSRATRARPASRSTTLPGRSRRSTRRRRRGSSTFAHRPDRVSEPCGRHRMSVCERKKYPRGPWRVRATLAHVPETHFDDWIAQHYDTLWPELLEPPLLDSAVDVLAEFAAGGGALEFGIGTGRLALPLSRRGVHVHGIELSSAMVAALRAKPGSEDIGVTIADFATATVADRFQLVYLVRNTITNLTTQDEQVACFHNAAAHLDSGGLFVIENYIPALRRLPPGETRVLFAATPTHVGFEEYDVELRSPYRITSFLSTGSYERSRRHTDTCGRANST